MPTQQDTALTQDDTTLPTTADAGDSSASSVSADAATTDAESGTTTQDAGSASGTNGSSNPTSNDGSDTASTSDDSESSTQSSNDDSDTASTGDGSGTATVDSDSTSSGSADTGTTTASSDGGTDQHQVPAAKLELALVQPASLDPNADLVAAPASTDSSATDASASNTQTAAASTGVSVNDVIAIGTTLSKIMAASSPDYTMRSNPVAVLPKGADPLALKGVLPDPVEMRVVLRSTNSFPDGYDLVFNLPIVVQWRCGGSYNGTGRYITGASMFLDSGADTGSFYKVDVDASFANPFTSDSPAGPVAGVDLLVSIKVVDKVSPDGQVVVLDGTIHGDGSGKMRERP